MAKRIEIFEEGLEEHPKANVILGNLLMILWITLGTLACWFFNPSVALVFLVFAIIMVYVVLRKLVCTNCYYYGKWCPIGWGKFSAVFFNKGNIEEFSTGIAVKLAPITYGLLAIVPIILIVISVFQQFAVSKIIALVLLLSVSFYSASIGRKKGCAQCKMRLICPGSAVK